MCHQWIWRFIQTLCYTPPTISNREALKHVLAFCRIVSDSLYRHFRYLYYKFRKDGQMHFKSGLRAFNDYRWEPCYHQVLCGVYASIYTSLCRRSGLFSHTLAVIHLHTEPTHSPYQLWSIWHHVALYLMLTLMLRKDISGIQNSSVKALLSFSFSLLLICSHHIILCSTALIYIKF